MSIFEVFALALSGFPACRYNRAPTKIPEIGIGKPAEKKPFGQTRRKPRLPGFSGWMVGKPHQKIWHQLGPAALGSLAQKRFEDHFKSLPEERQS